jgi:cytochrome c2
MKRKYISLISVWILILFVGTFLVSCGSNAAPTTSPGGASDGKALMQERCTVCHSTDRITTTHKTADQWTSTVTRMISHGAQLNTQEQQTLITYLAATYK